MSIYSFHSLTKLEPGAVDALGANQEVLGLTPQERCDIKILQSINGLAAQARANIGKADFPSPAVINLYGKIRSELTITIDQLRKNGEAAFVKNKGQYDRGNTIERFSLMSGFVSVVMCTLCWFDYHTIAVSLIPFVVIAFILALVGSNMAHQSGLDEHTSRYRRLSATEEDLIRKLVFLDTLMKEIFDKGATAKLDQDFEAKT